MLKVAFIIDTIESPTAGTEKQLLLLIKRLDLSRFEPTLFVLRSSYWLENEFDLCPLEIIDFRSFATFASYCGFYRFVKMLRNRKYGCLQTHFVESNIVGIAAAKLSGVPLIVSSRRDQGYWHTNGKLLLYKILNRWVNVFVANCHATAKWVADAEEIETKRIKVIYNGAELEQFSISTNSEKLYIRSKTNLPVDYLLIGIVANLRPVKRIDIFLQAALLLSAALPTARFVVIGDGELRQELELLATQLGIFEKTHFLGMRTDIPYILKALDIAVLSSDSESFSNSIVEYMATGLPVVATEVGGCREMIEEGVNGYLVPPSDSVAMAERIIALLTRTDREIIGQRNSIKARKLFTCEAMVSSFEQLYIDRNLS